jgi:D-amino peptidase
MMEGLDETFDAVIFVGYHAKAETPRGLFAHTGSGVLRDLTINGKSVGEGGMNRARGCGQARDQYPRRRAAPAGRHSA